MKPPLTAVRFDKLAEGQTRPSDNHSRVIWTLAGIGKRIGCGPDFVRDNLAKQQGSPVKQIGSRYYAFESDLLAFLRFKDGDG